MTTRDDFFEKRGIFVGRLALVRCPPGSCRTPESRKAHAVAKVGFVCLSETYFEFKTVLSEFILHMVRERLSAALLGFKLCL